MKRAGIFACIVLLMVASFSLQSCRRGTFITRTVKYGDRSASAVKRPSRKVIKPGKHKVKAKKKINRSMMNR
jgi:hypothetical protein